MRSGICLVFLLSAVMVAQDRVSLREGGRVFKGRLVSLNSLGVTLLVAQDGQPLVFAWQALAPGGLKIKGPITLKIKNGDRISGQLERFDGKLLWLKSALLPRVGVPVQSLAKAPEVPEESPNLHDKSAQETPLSILKPKAWAGKLALLGNFTAGNVDAALVTFNGELSRQWTRDRFNAKGEVSYGVTKGETTASRIFGSTKLDHFLEKRFYLYGNAQGEHDEVADLDLRALLGGGVGLNLWTGKKKHQALDVEGGVAALFESFQNQNSETRFTGRFFVNYQDIFFKDLEFSQSFEFLLPFSDPGAFVLRSRTVAAMDLGAGWAFQNRLELDYLGDPAEQAKNLDVRFLAGLQYSF